MFLAHLSRSGMVSFCDRPSSVVCPSSFVVRTFTIDSNDNS